ncbi:MAG: hypothetical protein ACRD3O_00175 [Terriglobia bacterium]
MEKRYLYPLATQHPGAFHDITTGNYKEPCETGTVDCPDGGDIGYSAGVGYDQVTGLGSLDVSNFVAEWTSVASVAAQQGQNFELSISPASLSLTSGQSGSSTVRITAVNGFNSTVDFSCTVASTLSGTTCAVSPTSITAGSASPATVTVTIPASSTSFPKFKGPGWWAAAAFGLTLVMLGGIQARRRNGWLVFCRPGSRLRWSRVVGLLLLCFVAASLSCSGGGASPSIPTTPTTPTSPSSPQVAPVSSLVVVTGTAPTANGASISHSALVSVTLE